MRRAFPLAVFVSLLVTISAAKAAGWHETVCDGGGFRNWLSCLVTQSGARPAAAFDADKAQFVRVLLTKNSSGVIVQFVRDANGAAQMEVRDPYKDHPPYTLPLPKEAWQTAEARWKALPAVEVKAEIERKAQAARDKRAGIETICLHPWNARVESNLHGPAHAVEGNACDNEEVVAFAAGLAQIALSNDPACRLVDNSSDPFPPSTLELCLYLQGKRGPAASALNGALTFCLYDDDDRKRTLGRYRGLIAPSAEFDFAGHPASTGADAVANAWLAEQAALRDGGLQIDTVRGFDGHADVEGALWRIVGPAAGETYSHYERAPSHQRWQRQSDGAYKLVSWTVDAFVLDPDR